MKISIVKIIVISCYLAVVSAMVYRDIQIEQQYQGVTGDLRNRIVGARLQKDGVSPYFYKWKPEDDTRYYDPNNFEPYEISYTTTTPFFHHIISPIIEFPQQTICHIWLIVEYLMFFICVAIALSFAIHERQQLLILVISILFLYTKAWQLHVQEGQSYFFIPFFFFLVFYFLSRKKILFNAFMAGLCMISILLIRPNTLIFFLPFLLLLKQYTAKYLMIFFIPLILITGCILISKKERSLWVDYKESVMKHVKYHQHDLPTTANIAPDPGYKNWEGWDQVKEKKYYLNYPLHVTPRYGNVQSVFARVFNYKIPVYLLNLLSLVSIVSLLTCFYFYQKPYGKFLIVNVSAIGFCLYMISDLFSPILRYHYYGVQWFFPLLLFSFARTYKFSEIWILALAFVGLFLGTIEAGIIPLEHTLGEYIMFLSFIVLSFNFAKKAAV